MCPVEGVEVGAEARVVLPGLLLTHPVVTSRETRYERVLRFFKSGQSDIYVFIQIIHIYTYIYIP